MATSTGPVGGPRRAKMKPASGSEPASENTQGLVIPKTQPNAPGAPTNPPVKPETPQEKSLLQQAGDLLDKGEIGFLNSAKDGITGVIDSLVGAAGGGMAASVAGAIGKGAVEIFFPTNVIDIIPGGKLLSGGKKAVRLGEAALTAAGKQAAEKLAGKTAEKAAKEAADKEAKQAAGKKGAYSKGRKKRVKCFCVQDRAKGGRDEYDKQLKRQQDGINSMTADEYLSRRRAFTGKDPCSGYAPTGSGKTSKRSPKVAKDAKAKRLQARKEDFSDEFRSKGYGRADAKRLGEAKATRELGQHDALHNQDMVAGGQDPFGVLSASGGQVLGDDDFGLSDTNRHIGSQWNGERIKSIDAEACEAGQSGNGNEKMNTELRSCGKHEASKAGCRQKGRK